MANNKIVLKNGTVLVDMTGDTAEASHVEAGKTFHSKSGEKLTGTSTKDADTSDGTITVSTVLSGSVGYSHGNKITGEMPNNQGVTGTIATKEGSYTIPVGYHDGSGTVALDATEKSKLTPENIRQGVEILGVEGSMSGDEAETPETGKTVTPGFTEQVVTPGSGFTCFKQITVGAISVQYTDNSAGGKTVTIG